MHNNSPKNLIKFHLTDERHLSIKYQTKQINSWHYSVLNWESDGK